MPTFTIKEIQDVFGKRPPFFRLLIDGKCVIEEFKKVAESKYRSEIGSMYALMARVANGDRLPHWDFKYRTDLHNVAFEVKTPNLRFYGMKYEKIGSVIVLCGHKNTQKKDERKVNGLITEILKQQPKNES